MPRLVPGQFGIVLGGELARSLGVREGDAVTLIAPSGQVTPAGVVPRIKQMTVVGTFDSGHFEYDSGLALLHQDDAARIFRLEGPTGVRVKLQDLQKAREVALSVLKPSQKDIDHGFELHAESLVFESYGFAPRAAVDGAADDLAAEFDWGQLGPRLRSEFIAESDQGADIAYHLGKNPMKAAQIAQMSPVKAARELTRLAARHAGELDQVEHVDRRSSVEFDGLCDGGRRLMEQGGVGPSYQCRSADLGDPQSLRRALVLREVLGPPRSESI